MRMGLGGVCPGQMENQRLLDIRRERRARRPPAALSEPFSPAIIYDRTRRAVPAAVSVVRRELDAALGAVAVTADRRAAIALLVRISDVGKGPERRNDSPGLGVGLDVMRASCDRMTVSPASPAGGTLVRAVVRGAVLLSDADVRFARAGSACTASARLRGASHALRGASRALRDDRSALLAGNREAVEEAGFAVARSQRLRSDLAA